ncbi:hypothetical protein FF38_10425, partial [Lucilia cuprina]
MEKSDNESVSDRNDGKQIISKTETQHETNQLPSTFETFEANNENYASRQQQNANYNDDGCNDDGARSDELIKHQLLKKRNNQKLKATCEKYDYDLFKLGKSINMPSAPSVTSFSYIYTSTSPSSASSLSSESISSNTTTFINNSSKKTSVINNNCNNRKTFFQHNHQIPPRNNRKKDQQMQNCKEVSHEKLETETLTLAPIPKTSQSKRQMQCNQQVKSSHHGNECNNTHRDLNYLRKRKLFVKNKVEESLHKEEELNFASKRLQYQEGAIPADEIPSLDSTLTKQSDSSLLDNLTLSKEINKKKLSQIKNEITNKADATVANTSILSKNVNSQIFDNSLHSEQQIKTPTKTLSNNNKKRHFVILNDNNFRQQLPNNHKEDPHESHINICLNYTATSELNPIYGQDKADFETNRCEEFESLESSEYLKRLKSFRRNSSRKSSNGATTTNSSPKHLIYKPRSPTQNSEVDSTVESSRKRFSYCSSCSSSNSCNCDITGENSNTLYEGFGIGVVVSSSYTDDCGIGSGGTLSLASAANGQPPLSSFRGGPNTDSLYIIQQDNDQTANASDDCSDFDDSCSEPPFLIEDLPRVETENKILSNNLKNYSKFQEKLYKKQQRFMHFSTHCEPINSYLQSHNQIQSSCHRDIVLYNKDSIEQNIILSYSNNSLSFNMMDFDASNKIDVQSEALTRSGIGTNSGGVKILSGGGVEDADQNELNNIY